MTMSHLPEKYQERAAARRRGLGGHQTEFRGFTIQVPPKEAASTKLPEITVTNDAVNEQQQRENQTTLATTMPPPPTTPVRPTSSARVGLVAHTPPSVLRHRTGSPSVVMYGKNTDVATPGIVASGGGMPRTTRLASRESGVSPSYQITWGRETTVVVLTPRTPSTSPLATTPSRASGKARAQKRITIDDEAEDKVDDQSWYVRKGKLREGTEPKAMGSGNGKSPKKRKMIVEEEEDMVGQVTVKRTPGRKGNDRKLDVAPTVMDSGGASKEQRKLSIRNMRESDTRLAADISISESDDDNCEAEWRVDSEPRGSDEDRDESYSPTITRPTQPPKIAKPIGISRQGKERNKTVRIRVHKIGYVESKKGYSAKAKTKPTEMNDDAGENSTKKKILKAATVRINEADVVGSVVAGVIENFAETIRDESMREAIDLFAGEVDARMIEQTDLYDEHILLQQSLRKARMHKRHLRQRLLIAQRRREEIRAELVAAREEFRGTEEDRKRLEQLHGFLTDLEVLRDSVRDGRSDNNGNVGERLEASGPKEGIEGLITTVAARSGGIGPVSSTVIDATNTSGDTAASGGILDTLRRFNDFLEACDRAVREGMENR
ncbi:hypothetical protein BC936DRAFT_148703 [Jimgerdemannia flammicorona]|uniref:Inner kinetochore subunit AME1 domain-containing protein n=1 Tax=Jimgerdemannia flammicorona TaxID=994334 RepID=A0A433D2H8_9FUNG|nr:hypothetical protein BC936DRAFT_148703 [Jimgerdemannia flammicorona]